MKAGKINSSEHCTHCGHWAEDDEKPFRIYSKARAKWLETAAKMLMECEGDDDWMDWMEDGKELSKKGE
jgi:hypothetical protein